MTENELQLSCFLDKDVKYLMSGIKNKLKGQLEKRAETLEKKFTRKEKDAETGLNGYSVTSVNLISIE